MLFKKKFVKTAFSCKRGELTVRGTQFRPNGEALPAAIVCHGFMATEASVAVYAEVLASLGYCVFTFDFCGGCVKDGKSDGKTTEMSVLTEVEDLKAVMAYANSLPYTNGELLLAGCSQGGIVSALAAAQDPEAVSRLVLFYPAFCIPDDARAGKMMFAEFDPQNIPETVECGPMLLGRCYPADVIGMDPFKEIAPYKGLVLLLHGTGDTLVRPEYSVRAAEVYENAELCLIKDGEHSFNRKHDRVAIRALKRFAARP